MGLDGVELVMTIEEEFGIEIDDRSAEHLVTPRHVIEYVMARVNTSPASQCTSLKTFNRFRAAAVACFQVARSKIQRTTHLAEVVPQQSRVHAWEQLRLQMGAKVWPELVRPSSLSIAIALAGALVFIVSFCAVCVVSPLKSLLPAGIIGGLLAGAAIWGMDRSTRSFRRAFPPRLNTVEKLVRYLAVFQCEFTDGAATRWSRDEVAARIRELTIDQLGIKESDYDEDARFIEELGMS